MPIYINGVSGVKYTSASFERIKGSSILTSQGTASHSSVIIRKNNKSAEWFKGNGEVNFVNCTINGHKIAGVYDTKKINNKIKSDFKQQGNDDKATNVHSPVASSINFSDCNISNDVYSNSSKTKRVQEIEKAINVVANGNGNIVVKNNILSQNVMIHGNGDIDSEHMEVINGKIELQGSGMLNTERLKVKDSSIVNYSCITSGTAQIINSIIKLAGTFETDQNIKFNSCDFDILFQDNSISVIGEGSSHISNILGSMHIE